MYMQKPTLNLEKKLWKAGFLKICGLDEVGRGPLAGPVVAGAVVIENENQFLDGVRDSKIMTEKNRVFFCEKIKEISSGWGIGIVENFEIDELGLSKAIQKAMELAIINLGFKADYLIADGHIEKIANYPMKTIIDGDSLHYTISAASVIAKVTRDDIMKKYSEKYPEYGFEKHVGYGTKVHMEALKKFGPCKIHRKCFKPVAKFFEK
jgi:ribonuclease HII